MHGKWCPINISTFRHEAGIYCYLINLELIIDN